MTQQVVVRPGPGMPADRAALMGGVQASWPVASVAGLLEKREAVAQEQSRSAQPRRSTCRTPDLDGSDRSSGHNGVGRPDGLA
jgi:hypothetical protein